MILPTPSVSDSTVFQIAIRSRQPLEDQVDEQRWQGIINSEVSQTRESYLPEIQRSGGGAQAQAMASLGTGTTSRRTRSSLRSTLHGTVLSEGEIKTQGRLPAKEPELNSRRTRTHRLTCTRMNCAKRHHSGRARRRQRVVGRDDTTGRPRMAVASSCSPTRGDDDGGGVRRASNL